MKGFIPKGFHIYLLATPDSDHMNVCMTVANGKDALGIEVLVTREELADFGRKLANFPRDAEDHCDLEWKVRIAFDSDLKSANGFMRLSASVVSRTGRVGLATEMAEPGAEANRKRFSAVLTAEATWINRLGNSLQSWSAGDLKNQFLALA